MKFKLMLLAALAATAQAGLITNGGFESGFAGWTRADQTGGDGSFLIQTGALSPLNLLPVAPPPQGTNAAMTDAGGPGSHVLYQDFLVPLLPGPFFLTFQLYIGNGFAPDFFTPSSLDFSTPANNQQARVDIITTAANPFSVAAADVLLNAYQTVSGDPLVSGYNMFSIDVSALLQAHAGQTLRLRFAEVDNLAPFNFGVDAVDIDGNATVVPEPGTWVAGIALLAGMMVRRYRTNPLS
jgi:hypothetical protein